MRLLLTMMLLGTLTARAQVVGGNSQPAGDNGVYTMSVSTKLVVEAVNVKDKQGKSISGLTAKDFTVTEDGVPQHISFCEFQQLPTAPPVTSRKSAIPADIKVYNRLAITQIT